jgi:tetratricopeptide (TPR) repeat protein
MAMRSLGIGTAGTLIARNELQPQSEIVLADFAGAREDSALARTVTEALRIDLSESTAITLAEPGRVREILELMERPQRGPLDLETARELAIRGAMPAVIGGEIRRVGGGYVLTAQLLSPEPQRLLISHREAAANEDALIPAIDRLSKELRERVGEPLKSLRQARPLPELTTGSLEALRKYVEATRAGWNERIVGLLEETIALDSGFAMAWRGLGVALNNRGEARTREVHALTRAFELRDRLPERERYMVEGVYYLNVTAEPEKAIEAYENYLAVYPSDRNLFDRQARNNGAIGYLRLRRHERAEEILRQVIRDYPRPRCWSGHWLLVQAQVKLGKFEDANAVAEDCKWASLSVDSLPYNQSTVAYIAAAQGDYQTTHDLYWRAGASIGLAFISAVRGQLADAERLTRDAMDANAAREATEDYLRDALDLADRDMFTRLDAPRAVQGIQVALQAAPLSDLDPLDRPYLPLAALYAQAGRTDLAKAMLSEFESVVEPRLRGAARAEYARARGELALADGRYEEAIAEFRASDIGECLTCAVPGLIRSYDAASEPDSVMALLERYLATPHIGRLSRVDHAHLGPALERLGKLYDERGDRAKAAEHYARFVELWADADPELQPRVRAAQERLDEIMAERG